MSKSFEKNRSSGEEIKKVEELVSPKEIEKKERRTIDAHEHVVDIEAPNVKEQIRQSKELFASFCERHQEDFDLSNAEKVQNVIEAAEKENIFGKAKEIRELIFDKNISLYGVCYLSDECNQNCRFCPMGQMNWENRGNEKYLKKIKVMLEKDIAKTGLEREEYIEGAVEQLLEEEIENFKKRFKTMPPNEASRDIQALVDIGHQEICILSGEKISVDPTLVEIYAQIALYKPGIKEVVLNMGSYSENVFRIIRNNLKVPAGVKLQHRVFQETYDRDEYNYYMDRSEPGGVQYGKSKSDFNYRYNSQVAALKAGFNEVGIGALFGLSKFPLKEIAGLQKHAEHIKEQTGKEPKRCCLPLANQPEKEHPVDIKYMIPGMKEEKRITELIYALARLAMPTISIVSSERDNPETLEILDQYANHSTLFVHPAPGENIKSLEELKAFLDEQRIKPVGQAEVFSRKPADALRSWKERGYNILDFDVEKYDIK